MKNPFTIFFLVHKFTDNIDVILASLTVFVLHININWTDKIIGGLISVCFSLLMGAIVSVLKRTKLAERVMNYINEKLGKKDDKQKN